MTHSRKRKNHPAAAAVSLLQHKSQSAECDCRINVLNLPLSNTKHYLETWLVCTPTLGGPRYGLSTGTSRTGRLMICTSRCRPMHIIRDTFSLETQFFCAITLREPRYSHRNRMYNEMPTGLVMNARIDNDSWIYYTTRTTRVLFLRLVNSLYEFYSVAALLRHNLMQMQVTR